MAVADMYRSQLRLIFVTGVDNMTGKEIYKSKSFNNVKTSASTEQLYTIAQSLASLQTHPLFTIERHDSSEISGS